MYKNKLDVLFSITIQAGKKIMDIYQKDFDVEFKDDDSPLTIADKSAHQIISSGLRQHFESIPILSEEGEELPYNQRSKWDEFWLVDPLDGTKEFIKKNGEFTVNIALVKENSPVLGIIYAPAIDVLYIGIKGVGAYKLNDASKHDIKSAQDFYTISDQLPVTKNDELNVVASRSHLNEETESFINEIKKDYGGEVNTISSGSSLKFCLVAEGKAKFYPRYAPTMEWDTGAGQAIVESMGGTVLEESTQKPLKYNKENLRNPWFLVKN